MQFISLSVVFCLCLATSTLYEVNGKDVVIFRGERDRFTNVVGCSNVSNAVCFDESCVDCQCMVNQTFIQTRGQYGKCVSNELVVYATCKLLHKVYNDKVLHLILQNLGALSINTARSVGSVKLLNGTQNVWA